MRELPTLHHPEHAAQWLRERVTGRLGVDSRGLRPGDGFVAWPGAATDGRRYVPDALRAGAAACLIEAQDAQAFDLGPATPEPRVATYPGLKADTGPIAAAYFDHPSRQLDVLAVTGTNGKTSTTWWLAQALGSLQNSEHKPYISCGLIGTLGIGIPPHLVASGLTTPDPVRLQQALRDFADQGLRACAMEASSIGLAEHRLSGSQIKVAVFTNFTQDHLDYHGNMQAYWQAKAMLFDWPGLQAAVVNVDDLQGAALAQDLRAPGHSAGPLDLWTVSCSLPARLQAQAIGHTSSGLVFEVVEGQERHTLSTQLVGRYNVSNLLGVLASMRALGVPLADAVQACSHLSPVPGRMECIGLPSQPLVVVDYAHTPDALDKALSALRPLAAQRGGRLWCVFGCGGDRDAAKRPLMAAMAENLADCVVITSDNPRSEKPEHIISQILLGVQLRGTQDAQAGAVRVQPDRAQAIATTLRDAAAADVVLLAGKGHEDTQEIDGVKRPFSDQAHARMALAHRAAPGGVAP